MSDNNDPRGKIVEVRVFTDRATITRRKELALLPGVTKVSFGPLPLDLSAETFEAKAELHGGERVQPLRIVSVSASIEHAELKSERRETIVARIEAIDARLATINDGDATERHASELLGQYADIASHSLSKEWLHASPAFDKWGVTFDQLRKTKTKLSAAAAARRAEIHKLKTERQDLAAEQGRLGRPEVLGQRATVELVIEPGSQGKLVVDLGYTTTKAAWTPAYDVRHEPALGDKKERVRLTAIALVRQSTGEDWSEVGLIATTARPALSEPPPELRTLMVRGRMEAPNQEIVSTSKVDKKLDGAPTAGGAQPPKATVEHRARGLVSVPATGRAVRVELFEAELPSRSRLEIAPRERPIALEVAEIENQTGRVLLPGEVSVFRGPNYSGRTKIGLIAAKERFRLALGSNAALRIKRSSKSEPEKKGVITGGMTWVFDVRTVIENVSAAPVEVLLRDRLPVSRLEEASVKLLEIEKQTEVDAESGLTKLQLTIAPHTRREVGTSFKITAPKGFSLVPPPIV